MLFKGVVKESVGGTALRTVVRWFISLSKEAGSDTTLR